MDVVYANPVRVSVMSILEQLVDRGGNAGDLLATQHVHCAGADLNPGH